MERFRNRFYHRNENHAEIDEHLERMKPVCEVGSGVIADTVTRR
jgi:hypothetical protein